MLSYFIMRLKAFCFALCLFWICFSSFTMAQQEASRPVKTLSEGAQAAFQVERSVAQVFGQNLFTGNFSNQPFTGFNPQYRITVGDKIRLQLWGAIENQSEQVVDPQGNIFIAQVGPIHVVGVLNSELTKVIQQSLARVYKKDVFLYANLLSSQPVKVFVTGNVLRPGLYSGLSSESILTYLDRAGGIDPLRGSYLDIAIKRAGKLIETINLYDFLIRGDILHRQLYEGDVIIVGSRKSVIGFSGLVENPFQIEFFNQQVTIKDALAIVQPLASATHIAIERNQGLIKQVEYTEISKAIDQELILYKGDSVTVVADKIQGSIGIKVGGEHKGRAQYVLPYGATLSDLLVLVEPSALSNMPALQLYRESLAQSQHESLLTSLNILQAQVLGARSATVEEASLRNQEAELILQFVERAKKVKPVGQVVLDNSSSAVNTVLENGDTILIPAVSNLVRVSGEVLFPNAVVFDVKYSANDYILKAGGFSQQAKKSRILIKKANGAFYDLGNKPSRFKKSDYELAAGDEIIVLPDVDTKTFQHAKDIFQIVYQLALSAGVVLSIDN